MDGERRNCGRDMDKIDFPGDHDAEARTSSSSNRPEQIFAHRIPVQKLAISVNNISVQNIVGGQPELPQRRSETAAGEVSADTDSRADSCRESAHPARFGNLIVELAESGAGADPRGVAVGVEGDGAEVGEIENGEGSVAGGSVGEALVVMAAAADAEVEAVVLGAEDGGLDVGCLGWGEDDGGFAGGWVGEAEVSDGGVEEGGEGGGVWRGDDELGGVRVE